MSDQRVPLELRASASVGGLTVAFVGSAPVRFGGGIPAEGSVLLDVSCGEERQRLTLVGEADFAATHEAPGGYRVRVVSPYSAERISHIELEISAP